MLLICSEEEKNQLMHICNGSCEHCIFENMECPVDNMQIVTTEAIDCGQVKTDE